MILRFIVTTALCLVAVRGDGEPPLDPAVVRSLRERLAAGSVREANAALEQMKAAPHSRHGLLLFEARVRAQLRIEDAVRRLPELDLERTRAASELEAARKSTSTSTTRRLEERLGSIDRDRGELEARRQIESRLADVCADAWWEIAPRLSPAAADELADAFLVRLREERQPAARTVLFEMIGAVPSAAVMPLLMEVGSTHDEPPEIVVTAVAALGRRGDASATPALVAALAHPDWRVQSEAVEGLRLLHRRSAIPLLIERLSHAGGRLRDDLGFALRSLTGERFVADPAIWRAWWEKQGASFTMPLQPADRSAAPREGDEGGAPEGGTNFFGIGSFSKRVLFVLDVSGSMAEPVRTGTDASTRRTKLDVARTHLKSALAGLASDARFDVLLYAEFVESCFPTVQPADDAHRGAALAFVDGRRPSTGTNLHGALLEAFRIADLEPGAKTSSGVAGRRPPEVDTIFFLTDGFPTSGRVQAPELILREIAGLNRTRRIRIHTVGIGGHDRAFLQALAAQNGGDYQSR